MITLDGMASILRYLFEYRSLSIDLYHENHICSLLKLSSELLWLIHHDSYPAHNAVKTTELIGQKLAHDLKSIFIGYQKLNTVKE